MWMWLLIGWPALNAAFVLNRYLVTRERKADRQVVLDVFDRKAVR